MRSIKNRLSALEKKVGLDSSQVDPQHTYFLMERLEICKALSEAHRTGREMDVQELEKKFADNCKALRPYRKYPFPPVNAERLIEALERQAIVKE